MQPTLVARPFHREGWVYEEKYNGWRMVAYKDGGCVTLISRQDRDHTKRFPELAAAIAALPADQLVLDGAVAVFDERFVSRIRLDFRGRGVVGCGVKHTSFGFEIERRATDDL